MVKRLPTMQETRVQSLGQEDLLEKEMATHSSILAWRIPWMEEPGGLLSTGSPRVGHDWATSLHFTSGMSWDQLALVDFKSMDEDSDLVCSRHLKPCPVYGSSVLCCEWGMCKDKDCSLFVDMNVTASNYFGRRNNQSESLLSLFPWWTCFLQIYT